MERTASCCCGQLKVETKEDPVRVSVCHCYECQRRTGSTYGAQARFDKKRVRIVGEASEFVRIGDEGCHIHFYFCPTCGSTVYYTIDDFPDVVGVPVGGFADKDFPPPSFSVYEARMHSWVGLPDDIEHMD